MKFTPPDLNALTESTYLKKLSAIQAEKRQMIKEINDNCLNSILVLKAEHDVKPKQKATEKELVSMIGMVLDTNETGTKVIRAYALEQGKDDQWKHDIAKSKAGKLFESALESYSNHPVMIAIKNSPTYCKKTICKQTVTGALNLLYKHVKALRNMEAMELENKRLKEKLELKASLVGKAPNWELAKQLRSQGETIRGIAQILGVGKSTVQKYLGKG